MASVPCRSNQDVGYFGFEVSMTPETFRKLVPPGVSGPGTRDFARQHLAGGGKLGQPFLQVNWNEAEGMWEVYDHEGRSRVDLMQELYPGQPVPVHVFPRGGLRARHITPEMKEAPFLSQDGLRTVRV